MAYDGDRMCRACVETSLGTRFIVTVPYSASIAELGELVRSVHLQNFPEFGAVDARRFKVLVSGYWYAFHEGPIGVVSQGTDSRFQVDLVFGNTRGNLAPVQAPDVNNVENAARQLRLAERRRALLAERSMLRRTRALNRLSQPVDGNAGANLARDNSRVQQVAVEANAVEANEDVGNSSQTGGTVHATPAPVVEEPTGGDGDRRTVMAATVGNDISPVTVGRSIGNATQIIDKSGDNAGDNAATRIIDKPVDIGDRAGDKATGGIHVPDIATGVANGDRRTVMDATVGTDISPVTLERCIGNSTQIIDKPGDDAGDNAATRIIDKPVDVGDSAIGCVDKSVDLGDKATGAIDILTGITLDGDRRTVMDATAGTDISPFTVERSLGNPTQIISNGKTQLDVMADTMRAEDTPKLIGCTGDPTKGEETPELIGCTLKAESVLKVVADTRTLKALDDVKMQAAHTDGDTSMQATNDGRYGGTQVVILDDIPEAPSIQTPDAATQVLEASPALKATRVFEETRSLGTQQVLEDDTQAGPGSQVLNDLQATQFSTEDGGATQVPDDFDVGATLSLDDLRIGDAQPTQVPGDLEVDDAKVDAVATQVAGPAEEELDAPARVSKSVGHTASKKKRKKTVELIHIDEDDVPFRKLAFTHKKRKTKKSHL